MGGALELRVGALELIGGALELRGGALELRGGALHGHPCTYGAAAMTSSPIHWGH